MNTQKPTHQEEPKPPTRRTAGFVAPHGTIVELVYDGALGKTALAIADAEKRIRLADYFEGGAVRFLPYPASNNLLRQGVVVLPEKPEEFVTEETLLADVKAFIHRYVAVSSAFEEIASHYVLLSWIYDGYRELPYLRVRGDFGTGKTRFLMALGSLCYKAIFASGASTVAPLFHTLDAFRGTLVLDEGDFRFTDEKAEIVKILNNGNVRGFPVLRMDASREGVLNPRAFHVFGPKIVATRGDYEDRALESRFLSEDMTFSRDRHDVPITLPDAFDVEARSLRNQLLLYRFQTFGKRPIRATERDVGREPRIAQISAPLLAVAQDARARATIDAFLMDVESELAFDRGMAIEAQILAVIRTLAESSPTAAIAIRDITAMLRDRFGGELGRSVSNKSVGFLVRRRLQLKTQKSHGIYTIPLAERAKLQRLYERYAIIDEKRSSSSAGTLGT